MSDFRFANPDWSQAMWIVIAALALLVWLERRQRDVLSRFLSATMQGPLVSRLPRSRRWTSIACLGIAGGLLVVALMRPQHGLSYRETPQVGAQLMVCLDVSKSMLAEDAAPNRLERAKAELSDLLSYLDGDQVGLIAFAGRATVLCPLTPDFGFFKLILDGAGPQSVGRGGTRLEEPIRKALEGFRTESDVSRVLILITDGEDHDSHPLDAARAAAERGIKIVAIGFGDEAGSGVYVADPRTGARAPIRDAEGRPVTTRLDGDTLREMALATDGAYIPAGTGTLDLKSIYDAHVKPLIRGRLDHRGHAVRKEAFQWAVLGGLLFLIVSVLLGAGPAPRRAILQNIVVFLVANSCVAHEKQQNGTQSDQAPPTVADGVQHASSATATQPNESAASTSTEEQSSDPRVTYNDALAFLDDDFDQAERMLSQARRDADRQGEVRYRATFNLGWVEVKRADASIADAPHDALAHLRRAADWFRDAVRLRPDQTDARRNLEVVLRRIIELADALAGHDERKLDEQMDALIEAQRQIVAATQPLVDRASSNADPNAVDLMRSDFRHLAVEQRKVLSDGQAMLQVARNELDAIESKQEADRTPQEKVQRAQLSNLLHYANRANQRLGQARSQMRQRQAERSFRRAAAALTELKRARDQLRGPVEVLDAILADALSLAQLTSVKGAESRGALSPHDASRDDNAANRLPWLTRELIEETQQSLSERSVELTVQLREGIAQAEMVDATSDDATSPAGVAEPNASPASEASADFAKRVRASLPFLEQGNDAFQTASRELAADRFDEAADRQMEAIEALRKAREQFLDLRGLIELAYARETDVQRSLPTKDEQDDVGQAPVDDVAARLRLAEHLQSDNLRRLTRIEELMEADLAAMPDLPPEEDVEVDASQGVDDDSSDESSDDPPQRSATRPQIDPQTDPKTDARRQQYELARRIAAQARNAMTIVRALASSEGTSVAPTNVASADNATPTKEATTKEATTKEATTEEATTGESTTVVAATDEAATVEAAIEDPTPDEAATPVDLTTRTSIEARRHADLAVEHLRALRRLFFSIVEHLRETAQRQAELNDDTEAAAALTQGTDGEMTNGPLAHRQRELQSISHQIAAALQEQAEQPHVAADQQDVDPKQREQLRQIAERFADAGKLVTEGSQEMEHASDKFTGESAAPLRDVRQHQDAALERLVAALALLQPPQPQDQSQNEQQNQQQDQQEGDQQPHESGAQDGEENTPKEEQSTGFDPSRLLQAVRDREAQRRRDRERRSRFEQEPVEKDW